MLVILTHKADVHLRHHLHLEAMKELKKTVFVADSIHGTIQITRVERRLLSVPVINRLHDILQNSTAYLTYPSARHTRFGHSLGAMHIAGNMFRSAVAYCDDESDSAFLNEVKKFVESHSPATANETLRNLLGDDHISAVLGKYHELSFKDSLYNSVKIASLDNQQNYYFLVAWQAVRIAAVLHDIGHPPFSHVVESALDELNEYVNKHGAPKSQRAKEFKTCFAEFAEWRKKTDGKKLHEWITAQIAERACEHLRRSYGHPTSEDLASFIFFVYLSSKLAVDILNAHGSIAKTLSMIIDGCIDCDRLDFVMRDIRTSGLGNTEYNLYRLVQSTRLKRLEDGGGFTIAYDVRAISVIENFLNARLYLYKYLVCHHRVVKTDILLKSVVVDLSKYFLKSKAKLKAKSHGANALIPNNISGLWQALNYAASNVEYFNHLLQWVDSWLLSILREEYFRNEHENPKLEELVTNKKRYYSIIKRYGDFAEIEDITEDALADKYNSCLGIAKRGKSEKDANAIETIQNRGGSILRRLFELSQFGVIFDQSEFAEIVRSSVIGSFSTMDPKTEVLFQFKKIDPGMKPSKIPFILNGSNLELLSKHSTVKDALSGVSYKNPLFYAFISKEGVDYKCARTQIGQSLSKKLADKMDAFIKKQTKEMEE